MENIISFGDFSNLLNKNSELVSMKVLYNLVPDWVTWLGKLTI